MLFYILIPLCIGWVLSYIMLWLKGHYPVRFVHLHLLILACTLWMCVAVWNLPDHLGENPLLYIGLLTSIAASILWVPATLSLAKLDSVLRNCMWRTLLVLQVVGYLVTCVAFCVLETAGTACVCGGCLVLVIVYVDKVYNSSVSSELNNALLSISI